MHRTRHARSQHAPVVGQPRAPLARPESRTSLAAEIGPVVYFIRMPDGCIKIGTTDGGLAQRKRVRKADWTDILAITPGYLDLEAEIHERFKQFRLGRVELFEPAPEIFEFINEIRSGYGLSLIEA